MAKRPLGLAKSANLKKQKPSEEKVKSQDIETKQEADLNIELDEEIEDDALAVIYGLFKTFDSSTQTNPKMAMGLVHECDSLLRERKKLPSRFHMCYGLALLIIAGFQDDSEEVAEGETPEEFINAAIDRFNVGMEEDSSDQSLRAAKATALVAKLDETLRKSRGKAKTFDEKLLKESQNLTESAISSPRRMADAVYAIQQFAVSLESAKKLAVKAPEILKWCSSMWPRLAKSTQLDAQKIAWQGMGELALVEGQNAVAEIIGDDDDDDEDEDEDDEEEQEIDIDSEAAQKATDVLLKAVEYLSKVQSDEKPTIYAQIAEAKISLGNITKNESPEQTELYDTAVKFLKKAQRLGAGDYHELIESLEDGDDDDNQ